MTQFVMTNRNIFIVDAHNIGPDTEDCKGIRPLDPKSWYTPSSDNDPYYGERPLPTPGKPKLKFI